MCGFWGHGFCWEEEILKMPSIEPVLQKPAWELMAETIQIEKELVPKALYDFTRNSHRLIEIRWGYVIGVRRVIPCGFNPLNCQADAPRDIIKPELVLKINEQIDEVFSGFDNIMQWMKQNFGANNDLREWARATPYMLSEEGRRLLAANLGTTRISSVQDEYYGRGIQSIGNDGYSFMMEFLRAFDKCPNDFWAAKKAKRINEKPLPEHIIF